MTNFFDKLKVKAEKIKTKAANLYDDTGATVSIKTNLTPEIQVFDTAKKSAKSNGNQFLKYAIIVRDKNGTVLFKHGEYPETDPVKSAIVYSLIGLSAYIFLRGIGTVLKHKY